jgi:hypothetical protein
MKIFITIALSLMLLFAGVPTASAQQVGPTSKLVWDEPGPDLATVSAYIYNIYPDGATTLTVMAGVGCTGSASPFTCETNFPAFTPGQHTLILSASNVAGESAKSPSFAFTVVVVPSAPQNIRIG